MSGVVRRAPLRAPVVVTRQTGAPRMNLLPIRPPLALNRIVLIADMIRTAIVPKRSSAGVQGLGFAVSAIVSPVRVRRILVDAAGRRVEPEHRAHELLVALGAPRVEQAGAERIARDAQRARI